MERFTKRDKENVAYWCGANGQSFSDNKGNIYGKAITKLADYEDKEEKGLLLNLPCKIGQTVYVLAECRNIPTILDGNLENATGYYCPYELYDSCPHTCEECDEAEDKTAVFEDTVSGIIYSEIGVTIYTELTKVSGDIGQYIFLTKEAAEKALEESGGE